MALKPQLLAGIFVALIASTANAQQFGPWTGPSAGSGSPIVYATAQAPLAPPGGNAMTYNAGAPPFAQTEMGPQSGEMQLVSSTYPTPVNESVPANAAGMPTDPNGNMRYMDSANAMYGQNGPPGPNNGMVYGPGPVAPPGLSRDAEPWSRSLWRFPCTPTGDAAVVCSRRGGLALPRGAERSQSDDLRQRVEELRPTQQPRHSRYGRFALRAGHRHADHGGPLSDGQDGNRRRFLRRE